MIAAINHPKPGSLPGPEDIVRTTLPNGIVVSARRNFNSPSVVIRGYLPVGGLFDPDEKLGLANFTASALMRGTSERTMQEMYDALESAGASLGFSCGTHTTGFSGKALVEDLPLLLDLLHSALCNPTFPDDQIEKLRAQLLTALALRAQNTGLMASMTFDQIVYNHHPYSHPDDGFQETVQAISRDDLVACHRNLYGPRGLVIAIVGAITPEEAITRAQHVFSDWQNPDQPAPPPLPPLAPISETTTRNVNISGKSQADIVMGVAGPPRRAPEFLAAALGNSVLGQFGMMGRIGETVREKTGLAYYAYSSISGGLGPGPWRVIAGVNPSNVERAVQLIRSEISCFVENPVSDEELKDSQSNFIGSLPLTLESNAGVASALLNLEQFELGLDYYQRYPHLINSITAEDVLQAACAYLDPDKLGVAVAGP
ncbi:MAG: pitrilysin family protein [Chloroflexota bacterium]